MEQETEKKETVELVRKINKELKEFNESAFNEYIKSIRGYS